MKSVLRSYRVVPSVVPADRESEITIRTLGENVDFTPGAEYRIRVYDVETATARFDTLPCSEYRVCPDEKGNLVFRHCFRGEQKHIIRLERPAEDINLRYTHIHNRTRDSVNNEAVLAVYSLDDDLYGMKAWKGDLHCHTINSDGREDICHMVGNYRSGGFDFLAITDHYLLEPSLTAIDTFRNAPVSMSLVPGEEVHHLPTERIHAVNFGGKQSVNKYWRENREKVLGEIADIQASLPELPEGIDREDYAARVWVSRKTQEFGGLSILAHPHWVWNDLYFMPDMVTSRLVTDGVYDCFELTNNTENDTTVSLWEELRSRGLTVPVVGTSDSHLSNGLLMERPADCYTYVLAPTCSAEDICRGIRANLSAAIDGRDMREWVFAPYRVTKFVRFIIDWFNPVYQKLCEPQGFLLAEYDRRESGTDELLAVLNERSDRFMREFYGY